MKAGEFSVQGAKTALTPEERIEKRHLIMRDALALVSLFAVMVVLFAVTLLLFRSFVSHRAALGKRWLARGELALAGGNPGSAIDALHSALAYEPGQRSTEIKLAEALGAAGRTEEALAYFNTLLESEPGNGQINLELARLAARQGNQASAVQHYQFALDGTWEGDGYVRRREVRLELAKYLLDRGDEYRARNELLIAAGNAPDDPAVKLRIAGLMEQAHDPGSALIVYRSVLLHRPPPLQALEGAGRSEFALGHMAGTRDYLERAVVDEAMDSRPPTEKEQNRSMLADAVRILEMYPSPELPVRARAERIRAANALAQARLRSCSLFVEAQGSAVAGPPSSPQVQKKNTPAAQVAALARRLADLATRWKKAPPETLAAGQNAQTSGQLGGHASQMSELAAQWARVPSTLTTMQLERGPELEQTVMLLVYQTETATAESCGAPTGKDALLLKMAQAPDAVEQR